jgi:hypothetical protein
MSIQAVAWALEYQDLPLDGRTGRMASAAKLVLIALANHASPEGTDTFPSVDTISRYTGLSERAVQYTLAALVEHGTIAATQNPLRRDETLRPNHRPTSYDLVAMRARGAKSPQGCKVGASRGAKSGRDFAPEPSLEPNPEPNPLISSNEEIISPRACAHARVGAREATPGQDGQLSLDGLPVPVKAVVPIHRKADETFDRFWAIYPDRKAKPKARQAWDKAIKKTDPEAIIVGVGRYIADLRQTGYAAAYPATWLNQRRWEDEPAKAGNAGRPGSDKRGSGERYQRNFEHIPDEAYAAPINY